jgi:LacI family transcriptional regulator
MSLHVAVNNIFKQFLATAVISIAQKQGINIPSDLSVVGFDDTQLATIVWPNISTVKQPINEMAELAITLLASGQYNDLSNLKSLDLRHILDFELIERESSSANKN